MDSPCYNPSTNRGLHNEIFILTLLSLSTTLASANPIVDCKDAGGYYGNLQITESSSSIIVKAAQGFELAENLKLNAIDASGFQISLSKKDCDKGRSDYITCAGMAEISVFNFSSSTRPALKFKGVAQLSVAHTNDGAVGTVTIIKDQRIATATHVFPDKCQSRILR